MFHRGIIFKSESLNIIIFSVDGKWQLCVARERLCQMEEVDLKDLGLFGQLWPQFWGWVEMWS